MTEKWFAIVGHDLALTQGDIIVNRPLLKWGTHQDGTDLPESRGADADRLFGLAAGVRADVIVMTQACDLEHGKVSDVVLCPCLPLSKYKAHWEAAEKARNQNPTAKAWKRFCEEITDGYIWNLFMIDSLPEGEMPSEHRIVDFHSVHTVPRAFLEDLSAERGTKRLRLLPPYREHLSQSFARFFMRVGLPENDRRRILIDRGLHQARQRWGEAHEIGHSLIPWHDQMLHGDPLGTLQHACELRLEAKANYAAGRLLFLHKQFRKRLLSDSASLEGVRKLARVFGNSVTSYFSSQRKCSSICPLSAASNALNFRSTATNRRSLRW